MLLFDIGANRGDATVAGLRLGYKVIALEPAPRVFFELITNFIYEPNVVPLRLAVSDSNNGRVEFYECVEDGLSTTEKAWLTDPKMPYNGKEFRTISVSTCTMDWLVDTYGMPDLTKIDVEGAEWSVLRGMTRYSGELALEWTEETLDEHDKQLTYLHSIGYTEFQLQFIEHHLVRPEGKWIKIKPSGNPLKMLRSVRADDWQRQGWLKSGLRQTADVGMLWIR